MGRAVFPPCCLAWGQTIVRVRIMGTSFRRTYAHTVVFSAPDPIASHCGLTSPPETPGHSQASLESRLPGEITITSDMQMTPPLWQKSKRNERASWWKWKSRVEKAGIKLNIQKTKIMASGPITSWQIDGETMETMTDYISLPPKSQQMVTAAMKLKDAYSLEEKLWPT